MAELTFPEQYTGQQERLRTLVEAYKSIWPAGAFGLMMINDVLRRADRASAEQDTVAMLRCYEEMRECE